MDKNINFPLYFFNRFLIVTLVNPELMQNLLENDFIRSKTSATLLNFISSRPNYLRMTADTITIILNKQ